MQRFIRVTNFSENELIAQPAIIDVVISFILSTYNQLTIQRFVGYQLLENSIIIIKEWCDYSFDSYKSNDQYLLLHIILSIKQHFQIFTKGYFFDSKFNNILIKKCTEEYVIYHINEKQFTIKTNGYVPVLTDFGISIIYKIGDKNFLIKNNIVPSSIPKNIVGFHKIHHLINMIVDYRQIYDESFDIFYMFNYNVPNNLKNNIVNKIFIDLKINRNNYTPNCIVIDDFINKCYTLLNNNNFYWLL